jgi:hypothetical protein
VDLEHRVMLEEVVMEQVVTLEVQVVEAVWVL